jgi:hypothetical protein
MLKRPLPEESSLTKAVVAYSTVNLEEYVTDSTTVPHAKDTCMQSVVTHLT